MFQTVFLPIPGLVPTKDLAPSDLIGVNKDNFLILDKLPQECVGLTFLFSVCFWSKTVARTACTEL